VTCVRYTDGWAVCVCGVRVMLIAWCCVSCVVCGVCVVFTVCDVCGVYCIYGVCVCVCAITLSKHGKALHGGAQIWYN